MIPLTQVAHDLVRQVIRPGDIAIDATAGNGHDTLFLAQCVGSSGTVYGLDIQQDALTATANRLAAAGVTNAVLLHRSHAELREALSTVADNSVAAVMLNLGYLPGASKQMVTRADSTVRAIRDSLRLLRPGGILTVVAYTGHPGGLEELQAVRDLLGSLPPEEFQVTEPESTNDKVLAPRLLVVRTQSYWESPDRAHQVRRGR